MVLDPFGGSGTTGRVAVELGRRAILIELDPGHADWASRSIALAQPPLPGVIA
ncbi:MAG: DNA methyltransferase [Acidobacteriota bacterium]